MAGRRPRGAREPCLALISLPGSFFGHAILSTPQNNPGKADTVITSFLKMGKLRLREARALAQFLQPSFQPRPTD